MRQSPPYDTGLSIRDHSSGYKDTGCFIAPKCLECPLPACVYEDRKLNGYTKRAKLYSYIQQTNSGSELAELANITKDSARRYLRIYCKAGGDYLKFIMG